MIVRRYKGRGRTARTEEPRQGRSWIYRLFMAWFAKGRRVRL